MWYINMFFDLLAWNQIQLIRKPFVWKNNNCKIMKRNDKIPCKCKQAQEQYH